MNPWATADRISDGIIDLLNREVDDMRANNRIEPLQLWAGLLLAVMGYARTAPPPVPRKMAAVMRAVAECLQDMIAAIRGNPLAPK